MNYLAHAFLGSSDDGERVGQLIADEIKGKQHQLFPPGLQRGILMHRWVDATTDNSPHLEEVKDLLQNTTGRVTPIAIDVIMDYFLSIHWNQYHPQPLPEFISQTYAILEQHRTYWPTNGIIRLKYLIDDDWLSRYSSLNGIHLTMNQMAQRKPFLKALPEAIHVIENHAITFEKAFHLLIHELIVGYKNKINTFATLPLIYRYKDGQAK
ncbi:MAG: hypothetical protein RLZZ262_1113 [Bacteroidota bacterium]|jgi:acyl carrier protein phosphodiesterase